MLRRSGFYSVELAVVGFVAVVCLFGLLASMHRTEVITIKKSELLAVAHRDQRRTVSSYGGTYEDPRLQEWLQQTVDRLIAASDRPNLQYRIAILNSPAINAFSLPSGQLYVTRGLLALGNDTSEVANVLAHEIAHITADHAANRLELNRRSDPESVAPARVSANRYRDPIEIARSNLAFALFSRAQEIEADRIGQRVASRAGFDPYGAVRLLQAMDRASQRNENANPFDPPGGRDTSHPTVSDRVSNLQINAKLFPPRDTLPSEKAEYLNLLDGLAYGEDPRRAVVEGQNVQYPKFGFTFEMPEGFAVNPDPDAKSLNAVDEARSQVLWVDTIAPPSPQPLASYLQGGIGSGARLASIEKVVGAGPPAVTARGNDRDWTHRIFVIQGNEVVYRLVFAAKQITPADEEAYRRSFATLRSMTATEIDRAQPLRLKVVTIEHADTAAHAWNDLSASRLSVERFLALNGLEAEQQLSAGDQVKIIVKSPAKGLADDRSLDYPVVPASMHN